MNLHIVAPEPEPLEIDPRPCELCGLTVDRHEMVDDGDGPIFFCVDTFEAMPHDTGACVCGSGIEAHIGIDYFCSDVIARILQSMAQLGENYLSPERCPVAEPLAELERRAELIRQIEVAAIFARLEAMDDPSKRLPPPAKPEPYRPAQSTVAAFRYLVASGDVGRLKIWLADRPKDAVLLLALLESPAPC
jgi:hypothetical protein